MPLKLIDPRSLLQPAGARVIAESQLQADPALVADGWELRFIADEERTPEATALYADIGFDVRAEPLHASVGDADECAPCQTSTVRFHAIYTRRIPT